MMKKPDPTLPGPERADVDAIDQRYLQDLHRGETPDRDTIVTSNPELADWLEKHFSLLDALHRARPRAVADGIGDGETTSLGMGEDDPDRAGPYDIRGVLGEGGMAVVYLAEQSGPIRRRVAVKLLKVGLNSHDVAARFDSERQALALMEHPGIARVFDGGTTEAGRPYFVMEYVRGVPITSYCDRNRSTIRERLDLFRQVCDAVQHAHQKGIIHRDLKPSNILVTEIDGRPAPKVIDFGVAKATLQRLTERTVFTEHGRILGTAEYMSPEQAEGSTENVDSRTDIYSLGVILYELLVGALPFDADALRSSGLDEIRRRILWEDPPRPSLLLGERRESAGEIASLRRTDPDRLSRYLRGDLDWITMKALEKDPARRYASASEMAADLARHLRDEPVLAGPPTAIYRLKKLVRKHRVAVSAGAAAAVCLVAGLIVSSLLFLQAGTEREEARRQAARAETISRFLHRLIASVNPMEHGGDVGLEGLLDRAVEEIEADPPEDPLIEASLRSTIGQSYLGLGSYDSAEVHLKAALEIHRRVLGEDALETIDSRARWGHIILHRGQLAEAEGLFRKNLEAQRRARGEDDPATLAALQLLATTISARGKHAEAEPLYRRALEGRRRVLGEEHEETLSTMNQLALLLQIRGKHEEAEDLLREILQVRGARYEEDHPLLLQAAGHLAVIRKERGEWREAEDSLRKVLEGSRRVLGDDHPHTIHWMSMLAGLLMDTGKLVEAEALSREALEGMRHTSGEENVATMAAVNNLAIVLRQAGKFAEAEELQRTALQGQRQHLGKDHPNSLMSAGNLGLLLADQGRFAEAEPLLREASEGLRRVLGEEHPEALKTTHHLAYFYHRMGRQAEAERLYRRTLDTQRRILGEDHPLTMNLEENLGVLLNEMRRPGEAEGLLRTVVEGRRRLLGDHHIDTVRATHNLGVSLLLLGEPGEAEERIRFALEVRRKVLGDAHPHTIESMVRLAGILTDREEFGVAERLYARALGLARTAHPKGDWRPASYRCSYGACLTRMKRYEAAERELLGGYAVLEDLLGADHVESREALTALVRLYAAWGKTTKEDETRRLLDGSAASTGGD